MEICFISISVGPLLHNWIVAVTAPGEQGLCLISVPIAHHRATHNIPEE